MSEGVSLAAEDGTIVYTNPAEDRMFGYRPGELIGRHVSVQNAYPPDENARIVGEVIAELKRQGHWRGEWLNRRKDGSVFVTTSRISAVEIDGRPHWLCVQEDVTEEKAAAKALRDSEARLEIATAAAEIGIWDWDLVEGRMTYSPRARAICGFPLDRDVTYEQVREIVHPDDHPFTSAQAGRALDPAIRDRSPYEYRILRPDGDVRWVLAHGEAVFAEIDGRTRAARYVGTLQDVTERRRLAEAEREGAQRLSLAIEAGRMAVWDLDFATETVTGSPELNRLLGFPGDATPSLEDIRARYYPGERGRLQQIAQDVMARGGRFMEAEYRYVWPDGDLRWLLLRCEILSDESGRPTKAVGVVADITERTRTEEALRASEARLTLAQRAAGAGVWDWDIRSQRLVWSPEIYAFYGIDPATDDLYAAWLEAVHPDDRALADATARRAAEAGESFSMDFRVPRPGGEVRWIRSQGTVVLGEDGGPARVAGINIDVTDQHRVEERLRAEAETLESAVEDRTRERDRIYELSNDLFAVAGFDGYLKSVNPAWTRLLGHSQERLLSRPFVEIIHPDDHAAAAQLIGAMRDGRVVRRFEDRLVAADGRIVWIAWTAVPEGELFYAVGRDVTRDREREEALRQAQKMEAVGQLTGGIAHDFNNLLQAVHGNLSLIQRRAEDDRIRRWASQGLQAAERGAKLTAQLLAFSRAQKLEVRPVAVPAMIAGMEDLLTRTLGPMIRIRLALDGEATTVLADPTQLEMAVLNLAINARDAMPDGGVLSIRTERCGLVQDPDLPDGDYLKLEISDTGLGMPPDVAARAFDPFFTTKGVGKGTGLGLSQVYGMARQAGGTARIRTRPGEGTTVTLFLRSTTPDERMASADEATDGPGEPARAATVLVIDDDPDVRRLLADALEALGYAVITAEDGHAGLDALDRSSPDLLLVDFAMPGMNGAEVASAARARRPDLAIVFASGYADTAAIDAVAGPSAVTLRKPFRVEELEAVVASALSE